MAWPILGPFGQDASGNPMASGRIDDLAVDPFNRSHLLALADSGLYQSINGGRSWTKLPGLDRFDQWNFEHGSLAFDPLVSGVALIASPADERVHTERGIYRTDDGGRTWNSAIGFHAQCADGTIGSPSVVVFRRHDAYAAGGCAVGQSKDDGTHWTWTTPDSGGSFSGVAADSAGNLFACGMDGVFMRQGTGWTRVIDFTAGGWSAGQPMTYISGVSNASSFGTCRITASPKQPLHVFFAAPWTGLPFGCLTGCKPGSDIFEAYRDSSGWHWQDLGGPEFANNRDVFVQTRPDPSGGFDVFYQNTDLVWYQRCANSAGFECTPGPRVPQGTPDPPWTTLGHAPAPPGLHADSTRVIFQPASPFCIRFVAGDGGIQKPDAGNCNGTATAWTYTDSGINAAEFYEVAVTSIVGGTGPQTDIYAAAQDNGAFALLSGQGWTHYDPGNDGLAIQATPWIAASAVNSVRTFYNDESQQVGGRGLNGFGPAPSGDPLYSFPCQGLVGATASPQQLDQTDAGTLVMLCATSNPKDNSLGASVLSSPLTGSGWTAVPGTGVYGRPGDQSGWSLFATTPAKGQTGYVIRVGGNLWSVDPPKAPRQLMFGWDVGPVAVSHDGSQILTFACPPPAPGDCAKGEVLASYDGGGTWHSLPAALDLSTHDLYGRAYVVSDRSAGLATNGQVSAVAIAPADSHLWAIGTLNAGLFVSGDSGRSWQRAPDIPNLDSVRFDRASRIYVGSYGRGAFGAIRPRPDTLALTATRVPSLVTRHRWRWTVTARTASGGPLSGITIRFVLINLATGDATEAGLATTNTAGVARHVATVPSGRYALLASWRPRTSVALESQTEFTVG